MIGPNWQPGNHGNNTIMHLFVRAEKRSLSLNQKPRLKSWTIITILEGETHIDWNYSLLIWFQPKDWKFGFDLLYYITFSLTDSCYQCNNPPRLANTSFHSHYDNLLHLKYSSTEEVHRVNKVNDILYLISLFSCSECRLDPCSFVVSECAWTWRREKSDIPFSLLTSNFPALQYDHVHIPQSYCNISTKKNYQNKTTREQQILSLDTKANKI